MPLTVTQIADIRGRDPLLAEALTQIVNHINVQEKTTGGSAPGLLPVPATIGAINVTAANGWFDIQIIDTSAVERGIEYFAEYSLSPNFDSSTKVVQMGASRNFLVNLGNQTLYWRGYSQYLGSDISAKVTFGTPPKAVAGGGATTPPAPQASQGSGTSQTPGAGFGRVTSGARQPSTL
jgi:hypothetical protein